MYGAKNTLRVANAAQAVLFEEELKGQISDGMWENTVGTGWEEWCDARVVVDPENIGRNWHPKKCNFNLSSKALLDVVGERMLDLVRALPGYDASYDMKAMKADLEELKVAFRTTCAVTVEDKAIWAEEQAEAARAQARAAAARKALEERTKALGVTVFSERSAWKLYSSDFVKLLELAEKGLAAERAEGEEMVLA
jgi:hypothetical protein